MDRTERFYKIDRLLHERRATPLALMVEELGVSQATVKRDLEYMRDRLNEPIVWDRSLPASACSTFACSGSRIAPKTSKVRAVECCEHRNAAEIGFEDSSFRYFSRSN